MGCGVKRETVGDIYVAEGRCDFSLRERFCRICCKIFCPPAARSFACGADGATDVSVPEQKTKWSEMSRLSAFSDGSCLLPGKLSAAASRGLYQRRKMQNPNYTPCVKGDKQTTEGDAHHWSGACDSAGYHRQYESGRTALRQEIFGASMLYEKEDIDRINELAHKAKTVGLTPEENEERAVRCAGHIDLSGDLRQQLTIPILLTAAGKRKLRQ